MDDMDLIRSKYRAIFSTEMGVEVLNHMLYELHFFNAEINHDFEIALSNYAKRLLWYIGIWDEEYIKEPKLVNKIMELPLIPGELN